MFSEQNASLKEPRFIKFSEFVEDLYRSSRTFFTVASLRCIQVPSFRIFKMRASFTTLASVASLTVATLTGIELGSQIAAGAEITISLKNIQNWTPSSFHMQEPDQKPKDS